MLILDEPTRGIDVGAKYEIYEIINSLAAAGKAVIVVSSELPELLGLSDRVYSLAYGHITGELTAAEATQENLMSLDDNRTQFFEGGRGMKNNVFTEVKDLLTHNLRTSGIYIAFVAIILIFTITTGGTLLSPENVTNIILQNAHILIMALGMILVIVGGHIDLSVGSVLAFASAVSAVLVIRMGMPWWVGVLAAIVVGIIVGMWQGFWVAYVGIPGVHRHTRGHAAVPRTHVPRARQRIAVAVPARLPGGRERLPRWTLRIDHDQRGRGIERRCRSRPTSSPS